VDRVPADSDYAANDLGSSRVRSGAYELPRLVLVSAPAGFGKTTLLSQWLSPTRPGGQAPRVAWLSLDEGDNDLRRLVTHLVGALETSGLEVGAQTTAQLESAHELSTETILTDLVNDVDLMAEETVVALDDYHVIDNAAVHEATSFLLEHLPRHVGLAIATRADPPLPLARLRSRADLVEVRAADLRFTPGESETFFNELMNQAPAAVADAYSTAEDTALTVAAPLGCSPTTATLIATH
jgi:LuxR family maltose regulon positive regulatory protein